MVIFISIPFSYSSMLFSENKYLADKVVGDHNDHLSNKFTGSVIEGDQGHQNKHYEHFHAKCTKSGSIELDRFDKNVFFLALKNEFAVSKVGKCNSAYP